MRNIQIELHEIQFQTWLKCVCVARYDKYVLSASVKHEATAKK